MQSVQPSTILERPFASVKPEYNSQPPLIPVSMIHHNVSGYKRDNKRILYYRGIDNPYGVSSARRVLSPGILLKRFDHVRDCLKYRLGLTTAQREVALRLLRLWAYYGRVYPKESQISLDPGCSKATYWRTVRRLSELGLVVVVNRYVIRPHAQISNLYRLDKLVVVIARYLAEHIAHRWPDWLTPALAMPDRQFWSFLSPGPGARAGPLIPAFADLGSSRVSA